MGDEYRTPAARPDLKTFYTSIMEREPLLYKYQFIVQFFGTGIDNIDFLKQDSNAFKRMTYFVQSASIPGIKIDKGKTVFLGTEFRTPGVKQFEHTWNVQMLLDQSFQGYNWLRYWQRTLSDLSYNGGGIKIIPDIQAKISLLASDNTTVTHEFVMEGVWIKKLGDLKLEYKQGGGDMAKFNVDFRYQYVYNKSDGDPLKAGQ